MANKSFAFFVFNHFTQNITTKSLIMYWRQHQYCMNESIVFSIFSFFGSCLFETLAFLTKATNKFGCHRIILLKAPLMHMQKKSSKSIHKIHPVHFGVFVEFMKKKWHQRAIRMKALEVFSCLQKKIQRSKFIKKICNFSKQGYQPSKDLFFRFSKQFL